MCTVCTLGAKRSQKKALDPLDWELQRVVNHVDARN